MNRNFSRAALLLTIIATAGLACSRGPQRPVSQAEVRAVKLATLPSTPDDPAWRVVPVHPAALLPQDVVEPRQLAPSTAALEAQAVTDGRQIAFRLTWTAPTPSDVAKPAVFSDACAVQLPAGAAGAANANAASPANSANPPNPMMGEAGRPVEITYWRAAWQAAVNGRPDTLAALYPNARIDHYPFESASLTAGSPDQVAMARRYAPARAVGNTMAGPRDRPVQDLVAEGAGTLRPADRAQSSGAGKATATGWSVVLVRPLPQGVRPGARTQVAFAVWQGAQGEAGARKMRSGWIPLSVEGGP